MIDEAIASLTTLWHVRVYAKMNAIKKTYTVLMLSESIYSSLPLVLAG
jgi:hypothetical protein